MIDRFGRNGEDDNNEEKMGGDFPISLPTAISLALLLLLTYYLLHTSDPI